MGVKDLWSVLSPVCEKRSLWELQGKTIAIDLSAWICDSQNVNRSQINMYLRNLFFRTSYLLLLGVKPVFVLEGKAPSLKTGTIQNRLKKNADPENGTVFQRRRLRSLQTQCSELLSCLGVTFVEAPGEAEAYCAHLNSQGIVDGVVSQDSDTFLYGAREVFRHFQLSPHYTYDAYSMEMIEKKLGLTRKKLIGFSVLTGSDYNSGVHNVGKETAVKFLMSVPDELIFERFLLWKDLSFISPIETENLSSKEMEIELAIREKALQDENFPNMEAVAEFTNQPEGIHFDYQWSKPHLTKFILLASKKLMWDEEYSIKKMVPLVGRWHLENSGSNCGLKIIKILGSPPGKSTHYKVTWDLSDIVTVERKDLVERAYPDLVKDYEDYINQKKVAKRGGKRGRRKKEGNDPLPLVQEEIIHGTRGGDIATNTLLNYFNKYPDVTKEHDGLREQTLLSDETNYLNLSGIIENIVTRTDSNPAVSHLTRLF